MAYVGDLFTCVDFLVHKGKERDFLSLWRQASEWAFVHGHSPRSWYLIRDPGNQQFFRSLTLWPTGTTVDRVASDQSAVDFLARCGPLCEGVEGKPFDLIDALGGLQRRPDQPSVVISRQREM